MPTNSHNIIIPPTLPPYRIDKYLVGKIGTTTRTSIQHHIKQGHILVNQQKVKISYKTRPNDHITISIPPQLNTTTLVPENIPLTIIYEDNDLLILNKPAHMVVHPACDNWTGTLVNALLYHYTKLPFQPGNQTRPGLVHRIDKGTSGLIVIAKTKKSLISLSQQFMHHTITRQYLALVWGNVKKDVDTISLPLARSPKDRRIMQVPPPSSSAGKHAITHYQVITRWHYVTLIKCTLETGRTHQIRAHMKHLGHPLFGDQRYGGHHILHGPLFTKYKNFIHNCFSILPHQALHAHTLGFIHPSTKQNKHFCLPPPPPFQKILRKWQRYTVTQKHMPHN